MLTENLGKLLRGTVKPHLIATISIWLHVLYSGLNKCSVESSFNKATPLVQPVFCGLLVARSFHWVPLFNIMWQKTLVQYISFFNFYKLIFVTAFLQILRHEILIQNQVLFIQPPVERVREHLIAELHIWISNITLLPRIQSSRYQVGMRVFLSRRSVIKGRNL